MFYKSLKLMDYNYLCYYYSIGLKGYELYISLLTYSPFNKFIIITIQFLKSSDIILLSLLKVFTLYTYIESIVNCFDFI